MNCEWLVGSSIAKLTLPAGAYASAVTAERVCFPKLHSTGQHNTAQSSAASRSQASERKQRGKERETSSIYACVKEIDKYACMRVVYVRARAGGGWVGDEANAAKHTVTPNGRGGTSMVVTSVKASPATE